MKLVIAIIQDDDAFHVVDTITEAGFRVTKLATTGGFLRDGNTTLLIGIEKEHVDKVINIIEDICKTRKQIITSPSPVLGTIERYTPYTTEVEVGGATVFVVDVDKFVKL
ncbi:hypothetical protein CPJCM30710_26920 [Clostridium polyendosporum]|uniref:Uncharacterized protein n=1 Tax=Clostridium polyendosporum TaxID=69208 RepID=A0A919S297_9CLOT|nr:cyclic-di-AMP receptor [Clostridium polyendosporum]GIM30026.1 hypothetical protein CPJCM30710_26920 [Clostridium polyendosporum]